MRNGLFSTQLVLRGLRARLNQRWWVLIVAVSTLALGVVELLALNRFASREITWAYPIGFDQAYYGLQAFQVCDSVQNRGFVTTALAYLTNPNPQGRLLQFQGALVCSIFGPGWQWLLNINFLYLLLLQSFTCYAAWYVGERRLRWALLSLGLLLALDATYFWAGGVMDFRLDFAALCLYGMFIAAAIRSRVFTSRPWSLVAGAIAAMLVCLRTLSLTYLVGVMASMIVYLLLFRPTAFGARLKNLGLASLLIVTLAITVTAPQLPALYHYYWVGHFSGQEPDLRAHQLGLSDLWGHLIFYPQSLLRTHLGTVFLTTSLLLLTAAAAIRFRKQPGPLPDVANYEVRRDSLVFCLLALVVPLVVLTSDVSKSIVVAGITTSAVVWLVLLSMMGLAGRRLSHGMLGVVLAIGVFIVGSGYTSWQLSRHLQMRSERAQVQQLLNAYDHIWSTTVRMGKSQPLGLSVLGLHEYLVAGVVDFLSYARHHDLLDLKEELGHSIFAITLDDAVAKINRSAFVITTSEDSTGVLATPFERTLAPLRQQLTDYVREHFIFVTRFEFRHVWHELYRRPFPLLLGTSGDWVMADGLVVYIAEEDKRKTSRLVLRGTSDMSRVPGLSVSARARTDGVDGPERPVPVDLSVNGNDYTISIGLAGLTQGAGPLHLNLSFSKYFTLGNGRAGADVRKLVIRTPDERSLRSDP